MISRLVLTFALLAPGAAFAQYNPSFNVINKSGQPIRELFATPAGDLTYGRSRLNGRALPPGASQVIRLPPGTNCVYDIRITYADGRNEDHRRVDTCHGTDLIAGPETEVGQARGGGETPQAGNKTDPSFSLVNHGRVAITEVYATPPGRPRGPNRLTDGAAISPGMSGAVKMTQEAGCIYDLHVVFADRQGRDRKATDLCKVTNLPVG